MNEERKFMGYCMKFYYQMKGYCWTIYCYKINLLKYLENCLLLSRLHDHLVLCFFHISFNWNVINLFFVGFLRDVFDIILNWSVIDKLFLCWHLNVAFNLLILGDNSIVWNVLNFGLSFDQLSSLQINDKYFYT